ncbi:TrlF family AAA-like ATPase [Rhizobium leguminosarum]|uniref:TrlF family AAA-like ATPase n=1 Tax=Rhizobium leguminosarum TaxID=384 RepID=UPI001030CB9A|nr:AAA family ATPase [Rhizobium leguminosarum]TAX38976.1 histidinol-phosphatase [Rhizobium leguminosarum]
MDLETLTSVSNGARFFRADLHVHSYGGSHDVSDAMATPDHIVLAAVSEGLSIVAIADHNEISNVRPAIAAGERAGILVVPAVELSAPEGHLLCYLPLPDAMDRFYNRLSIVGRGTVDCRCQTGTTECLNLLREHGGFAILAHVDGPGSFEANVPRFTPAKLDILCHQALLGFEVVRADSEILYTDSDTSVERRNAAATRIERLGLGSRQVLARVLNSDAHTLNAVGRNARNQNRITRYKMEKPSFDGLRLALDEADTRVRIEDELPRSIPLVEGITFEGGFLDGQTIHFNANLTCIVGGRGSGKSTAFEAVRVLRDDGPQEMGSVVDSDVWPDQITLFYRDETNQTHLLSRAKNGTLENVDDPVLGSVSFPIESYRQGETNTISKKAQDDPLALLTFLDGLVSIEIAIEAEDAVRTELNEFTPELVKARKNVAEIPGCERDLALKRGQMERLKKDRGEEIIKLQQRLESERRTRNAIVASLAELKGATSQEAITAITNDIREAAEGSFEIGAPEVAAIVADTALYEKNVATMEAGLVASTDSYSLAVQNQIATWKSKETKTAEDIDKKKKELLAAGIRLDVPFIQKLVNDEANLTERLRKLNTWKPHLITLEKKRTDLLRQRWTARSKVAGIRSAFATKASEALKGTLSDIFVTLKFDESALCPDGERLIIDTMGWRTLQQLKAAALINDLTLPRLLECMKRRDSKPIAALRTPQGGAVFQQSEIDVLMERLIDFDLLAQLETVAVHDAPRLSVTKRVSNEDGAVRFIPREFKRLSLGQQQSVLLALMLSSESKAPLIVDQPEDNLDSEFIYKTLVPVLRRAKERRQVIVVTHNANIAVLGDAEQIVVLKATNEQASISSRGSIDEPDTREAACAILEGSREAFERRARIYGKREKS